MRRRRYLKFTGVSIGWLAGCSAGDDRGGPTQTERPAPTPTPQPTPDPTPTPTATPGATPEPEADDVEGTRSARFEIVEVAPVNESFVPGMTLNARAEIENVGNGAGTGQVRFALNGNQIYEESVTLEPNERRTVRIPMDTDVIGVRKHRFRVTVGSSEFESRFVVWDRTVIGRIETAQRLVRSAISVFLSFETGADRLTDVTPHVDGYSSSRVVNEVWDADEPLNEADEDGRDVFGPDIEFVRHEVELLKAIARAQATSIRIGDRLGKLLARLAAEDRTTARSHRRWFIELSDTFGDQLTGIDQLLAAMDAYGGLLSPQADYGSKVDQFGDEMAFYDTVEPLIDRVLEGLDRLETARDEFGKHNYDTAELVAAAAADQFDAIRSDVSRLELPSLEPTIASFIATCDELRSTALDIRRDAAAVGR